MEKNNKEELTYVLFGAEAIQIYNISLSMLLSSAHLVYKVGAYDDVKAFVEESKKWDDFIEINKNDYVTLKKKLVERPSTDNQKNLKKNGKSSFFNFFK
ncbi:hypothetical protein UMM65_08690 [Aureibaculum sp. 2210JD6-5]|uniref:hypothetical protein n=1 Tax=Aureibaculum sp. 2210JD6-5 TaxID=3103957 RepID=UPI002AAD18E6|nr:hypothetical protein [Aureibaculum sp. 2210JD6-5]MDY7395316.1 hypothetical protein [Aureibaculum sp. 2210JD6-5]